MSCRVPGPEAGICKVKVFEGVKIKGKSMGNSWKINPKSVRLLPPKNETMAFLTLDALKTTR